MEVIFSFLQEKIRSLHAEFRKKRTCLEGLLSSFIFLISSEGN